MSLNTTEQKIMQLLDEGLTAFDIAEELNMQVVSVTNRINELKRGGRMKQEERRSLAPRRSVFWDIEAANKFRAMKGIDMAPVRTGKRDCLCCDRTFMSEDLKNQKLCNNCRHRDYAA
jgi:hypothetical protein